MVKKTLVEQWGWGCYPEGYNRAVHGPYDPARYYGPKDLALSEVKLSELPAWIARREKSPQAFMQMMSRFHHRWWNKFWIPKKSTAAGLFQLIFMVSTASYLAGYHHHKHHKNRKYHW